jgi:hypothetical protein
MFLFGYVNELRDAYEFYPFATFLILHTIVFSVFHVPWNERKLIERPTEHL